MATRRRRHEHPDPFEDAAGMAGRLVKQKRGLLLAVLLLVLVAAVGWFLRAKTAAERDDLRADVDRLEGYAEGNQALMGEMARDLRAAEVMVRWGELLQTPAVQGFHLQPPRDGRAPPGIGFFDPATGRTLLRLTGLTVGSERDLRLYATRGEVRRALGTVEPANGVAVVYVVAATDTDGFVVTDEPDPDVPVEALPARDVLVGTRPGR